jgi:hypothetical protein
VFFLTKKKTADVKNVPSSQEDDSPSGLSREDKIMNAMANVTVILMSTMMGAFTQVMSKAVGAMSSGMAEAFGGEEAKTKVDQETRQDLTEADIKMNEMISGMKNEIYDQLGQERKIMEPLLSDPIFDLGPKIIEKYNFNLPKLTQRLDDQTLTAYADLLTKENPDFAEMFKELTNWLNSLPKPSETKTKPKKPKTTDNPKKRSPKNKNPA